MYRILRFLLTGYWNVHKHEWETEDAAIVKIFDNSERDRENPMPKSRDMRYIYKCKTCGIRKIQMFRGV